MTTYPFPVLSSMSMRSWTPTAQSYINLFMEHLLYVVHYKLIEFELSCGNSNIFQRWRFCHHRIPKKILEQRQYKNDSG